MKREEAETSFPEDRLRPPGGSTGRAAPAAETAPGGERPSARQRMSFTATRGPAPELGVLAQGAFRQRVTGGASLKRF